MNPKSILMPHCCQKIGWWLLLLIPLVWGFNEILFHFFHETHLFAVVNNNSRFITMLFSLVISVSLFLICLSKEKIEDEMISQYRLRAVGISAFVSFIIIVVGWILAAFARGFRVVEPMFYITTANVRALLPFFATGLYYIIFKSLLHRSKKQDVQ